MQWFRNLRISRKLITGFLVVAFLSAVVGFVGIWDIFTIQKADKELYNINTTSISHSGNAAAKFQRVRYFALEMTIVNNDQNKGTCRTVIDEMSKEIDELLESLHTTISSKDTRATLDQIEADWTSYETYLQQVIDFVDEGKISEAQHIMQQETTELGDRLRENFLNLMNQSDQEAIEKVDNNRALAIRSTIIMGILILLGVTASILLGTFIARMIGKPIHTVVDAADKLALGDVNISLQEDRKDEIGHLVNAFNRMISNIKEQAMVAERMAAGDMTVQVNVHSDQDLLGLKLREIVVNNHQVLSNISVASEQIAEGSSQIAGSSMALSQGAAEQASSIEELTAALEEISGQTNINAQNARQVNDLAESVRGNAEKGNTQMQQMLQSMSEINDASSSISKVIKVIDDIAFQTNILALNAAVEAARAGQHGKGFAVVAEEVRNLAARSANAAKETTEMIEGSIKKTEAGSKIANETANALEDIVKGIEKVAGLVSDIATASNEQAVGIDQISQGIMQVSQVVQNNSATAQESAAASEELSGQAAILRETVSRFRLN